MSYLKIVPKNSKSLNYNIHGIRLRVIQSSGIEYTPDIEIKTTDLVKGGKLFRNASGNADKFKVNVMINKDETVAGAYTDENNQRHIGRVSVIDALDYWMREMTIFIVTFEGAVDIQDGQYIISKNGKRTQNYLDGYTTWELEFTKYYGVKSLFFKTSNYYTQKAINDYLESKKPKPKATATVNSDVAKLKKCDTKLFKYTATKTNYECVKLLQTVLKKLGYYNDAIDGWYARYTTEAVKKFQKNYKKKNLLVDGWAGPVTLECICNSI